MPALLHLLLGCQGKFSNVFVDLLRAGGHVFGFDMDLWGDGGEFFGRDGLGDVEIGEGRIFFN